MESSPKMPEDMPSSADPTVEEIAQALDSVQTYMGVLRAVRTQLVEMGLSGEAADQGVLMMWNNMLQAGNYGG